MRFVLGTDNGLIKGTLPFLNLKVAMGFENSHGDCDGIMMINTKLIIVSGGASAERRQRR